MMSITNLKILTMRLLCGVAVVLCCCCTRAQAYNPEGPFEYREIYLPKSSPREDDSLKLNNVDKDWAIWGHNLGSILPEKPSQTIYAKRNGNSTHSQFCFMSNHLFDYIVEYIRFNVGNERQHRFAILPNDNGTVCMCSKCRDAGNTEKDASPAVFHMIRRLAERFPSHEFYTSYYNTTRSLPAEPLPSNAGVLVSAMDYPPSPVATAQEQKFEALLSSWAPLTDKIYVWDYVNNFDDYFTPYPVFTTMQRHLQLYARTGVKGVFLNGSGTDYSSMSRVKRYVLAEMMKNPDVDWRPLVESVCRQVYPVAGEAIARFMLLQEDYALQQAKPLPLYEGVDAAVRTYLPEEAFVAFYDELGMLKRTASGNERRELEKLYRALTLTRLELKRLHGDTEGCQQMLDMLKELDAADIEVYNEAAWTIDRYVFDYEFLCRHAGQQEGTNLLRGVKLVPLTALDDDYSDISVVTDGMLGLPSNYHCGHLISSADPALKIAIPNVKGMKRVRVCLSRNKAYHIAFPLKVSLTVGGVNVGNVVPKPLAEHKGFAFVEFQLPAGADGKAVLTIVRDPEERTMAIDEIEAF